jgi:hypothetical protein
LLYPDYHKSSPCKTEIKDFEGGPKETCMQESSYSIVGP